MAAVIARLLSPREPSMLTAANQRFPQDITPCLCVCEIVSIPPCYPWNDSPQTQDSLRLVLFLLRTNTHTSRLSVDNRNRQTLTLINPRTDAGGDDLPALLLPVTRLRKSPPQPLIFTSCIAFHFLKSGVPKVGPRNHSVWPGF